MQLSHIRTQLINNGLVKPNPLHGQWPKPFSASEDMQRSKSAAIASRRLEFSKVQVTVLKKK